MGSRLSIWLTVQVGVLMVFSRSDRPGIRLTQTGERFGEPASAMRAGWAICHGGSWPIENWRPFRFLPDAPSLPTGGG